MNKKLFIGIGVVVILVLGVGGYLFTKNKKGASADLAMEVSSQSGPCKYDDKDLCKFITSWKNNKYYTVTSNGTAEGKSYATVFKSAGDDRTELVMSEGETESYHVITIGNTTYTKDYSDGKWFKSVAADSVSQELESDFDFDEKAEKTEDTTTYKKIGTEACGKLTCFKYQVIMPENTETTEYIYFDNKQYQLRKMRSEAKDGPVSESTFDYSKISIDEPSPTKEGSSMPTTSSSSMELKAMQDALLQEAQKSSTETSGSDTSSGSTSLTADEMPADSGQSGDLSSDMIDTPLE